MKKEYSYVAAFDLDKTIISVNSSKLIVKAARRIGLMRKRDFTKAILYSIVYKLDLQDANKIVAAMAKWLKGLKESDIVKLIEDHVVQEVLQLIRPEIRDVMKQHRQDNGMLVLLSSAMPYICHPVADHLEMDAVISSKLEITRGIFTGRPHGRLNFGKQKAVTMTKFCGEKGYALGDAYYYGDAFTDRFVMNAIGHPVCVKPEYKLSRMAKKRGWAIL